MAENNDLDRESILFAKIQRAEWAGRLVECKKLIQEFDETFFPQSSDKREDNVEQDEFDNTLQRIENEFRNQNDHERSSFLTFSPYESISSAVEETKDNIFQLLQSEKKDETLIYLETENLKATIFRVDQYDFALRGYLDDLDLEQEFYENIKNVSDHYNEDKDPLEKKTSTQNTNKEEEEEEKAEREDDDNGVVTPSWISFSNNLRIKTIVGDFSLFEMKGTWISGEIPNAGSSYFIRNVVRSFKDKINEIEPRPKILVKN